MIGLRFEPEAYRDSSRLEPQKHYGRAYVKLPVLHVKAWVFWLNQTTSGRATVERASSTELEHSVSQLPIFFFSQNRSLIVEEPRGSEKLFRLPWQQSAEPYCVRLHIPGVAVLKLAHSYQIGRFGTLTVERLCGLPADFADEYG